MCLAADGGAQLVDEEGDDAVGREQEDCAEQGVLSDFLGAAVVVFAGDLEVHCRDEQAEQSEGDAGDESDLGEGVQEIEQRRETFRNLTGQTTMREKDA